MPKVVRLGTSPSCVVSNIHVKTVNVRATFSSSDKQIHFVSNEYSLASGN